MTIVFYIYILISIDDYYLKCSVVCISYRPKIRVYTARDKYTRRRKKIKRLCCRAAQPTLDQYITGKKKKKTYSLFINTSSSSAAAPP